MAPWSCKSHHSCQCKSQHGSRNPAINSEGDGCACHGSMIAEREKMWMWVLKHENW